MVKINDMGDKWIQETRIGVGFILYVFFYMNIPNPVGFVWGIGKGAGELKKTQFEVYGSYILPRFRRRGIRTEINNHILKTYDVITTISGVSKGARLFMKNTGYKINKDIGIYYKNKDKT